MRLSDLRVEALEERHRRGYERHPIRRDEFDGWEPEQVWPDYANRQRSRRRSSRPARAKSTSTNVMMMTMRARVRAAL